MIRLLSIVEYKLQNLGIVNYGVFSNSTEIYDSNNKPGSLYIMTTTSAAARQLIDFKIFVLFDSALMYNIRMRLDGVQYIDISREYGKWIINRSPDAVGEITLVRIR